MSTNHLRLVVGIALLAVAGATLTSADTRPASRRDADLLKQKIATIARAGAETSRQQRRTTVTEREVNGYLAHEMAGQLPPGVGSPSVLILGTGRVSGRAVVDLDRVRQQLNATSLFNPASYLTGHVPVTATGVLRTSNGTARFQLESADVAGVPIPKVLLQQIVSYYSRSEQFPSGISLDDTFALPARIREIEVGRGQAIVVQ
jgi:hypothetical protein